VGSAGKLRRTWPQRLLLTFNVLLAVACLAAAGGLTVFEEKLSRVSTVAIDSPDAQPVEVSEPRNILIIGTDSAANLDEDDPVGNGRKGERLADVIMILRIEPESGTAQLISIPRDTRVELPSGEMTKINSAVWDVDGPLNLIRTIKGNFGISIDNYVQVDFAAFKDLVEQLGGVPVYFEVPVRDLKTGLNVAEPGCITLDPAQALAYARSRHFQFKLDGKWRYDQTGDLGRITRQQDFIKRSMRRASDKGLRNPSTAFGLVDAAVQSVLMDQSLNVGIILELVDVFRTFNPDELATQQIVTYSSNRGGISYQEVDWDETLPLLVPFWGYDESQELQPADVVVDVAGTRDEQDSLAMVVASLDERGFDADSTTTRKSAAATSITYGQGGFPAAQRLASHLVDAPAFVFDEDIVGPRVVLNLGRNFGGLSESPLPLEQLPEELQTPEEGYNPFLTGVGVSDPAAPGETPAEGAPEVPATDVPTTEAPTTDTTLPADQDPAFLEAAEAEGAPPGIVPSDPAKAAACH
jgi:LCP family protein required for cell wall assembly